MARVTIEIPEDLRSKLEARAAESGHSTLEEYLAAVVRAEADLIDYGAPDHVQVDSRAKLQAMLLESANSPRREMTAADWQEHRRRLIERHRKSDNA